MEDASNNFGDMPLGEVFSHLYGTLLRLYSGEDGADGPEYAAFEAFEGQHFVSDDFDRQRLSAMISMFLHTMPFLFQQNEKQDTCGGRSAVDLAKETLETLRRDVVPILERQAAIGSCDEGQAE